MSKEGLLISIFNSGQSIAELRKSNNNAEIKEIKEKFNVLRNNFSKKKKKQKKLEKISHRLEELEKKNSLTEKEEGEKKHYADELKTTEELTDQIMMIQIIKE